MVKNLDVLLCRLTRDGAMGAVSRESLDVASTISWITPIVLSIPSDSVN